MIVALDTSALGKLLVEEDESEALRHHLADRSAAGSTFCLSSLAVTELRGLAIRMDVPVDRVHAVVQPFTVVRLTEGVLQLAGHLPHRCLRTLGAIHVASAPTLWASGVLILLAPVPVFFALRGLRDVEAH